MRVLDDLPQLHRPEAWVYLLAARSFPRDPGRRQQLISAIINSGTKDVLERRLADKRMPAKLPDWAVAAMLGDDLEKIAPRDVGHLITRSEGGDYSRFAMAGLVLVRVLARGAQATLEEAFTALGTGGATGKAGTGRSRSTL